MSLLDTDSEELKNVLKNKLSSNGTLESLEGTLRAKLFACICPEPLKSTPPPAKETMLINELIRDYLKWNGYVGALAVMNAESNAPKQQMDKYALAEELGLSFGSYHSSMYLTIYINQSPLLYGLCTKYMLPTRQATHLAPFENAENSFDYNENNVIEFNS